MLDGMGSGLDSRAGVLLIGGGAQGRTWQRVMADLSGREIRVPEADELVALGAASQAAACLSGEAPDEPARRWETRRGATVQPPAHANVVALSRIRRARDALVDG